MAPERRDDDATEEVQASAESPPTFLDPLFAAVPRSGRFRQLRWLGLGGALAALLAVVGFIPAILDGDFIWDDAFITQTEALRFWSGLWPIWSAPSQGVPLEGHYWPLLYTVFWLQEKLWGLDPMGFHAVNVAFHLVNTLLVHRLLARLEVPGAWLATALFAVHPVHVESVAWVIELKDVMSGAFYLGALLVWLRFCERPHPARYALLVLLLAAGMLTKSVVVTAPVAMLLLQWWRHGRITGADFLWSVPLFLVVAIFTAIDLAYLWGRVSFATDFSLLERLLIATRALWFYLGKLIWPADLGGVYPFWEIDVGDPGAWVWVLGAIAFAGVLWGARHRIGRGPFAGAFFFALLLSPTLSLVDHSYMEFSFVADRFQYLASAGMLAVIAGFVTVGLRRLSGAVLKLGAQIGLLAVLGVLTAITWEQSGLYRDELTFYRHVLKKNPTAHGVHSGVVRSLVDLGRYEEAIEEGLVAVVRDSAKRDAHINVGLAYSRLDRFEEAERHYRAALALTPNHRRTLKNLVGLLHRAENWEGSLEFSRRMLRRHPNDPKAHAIHYYAAYALEKLGGSREEIQHHLRLFEEKKAAREARR